MSNITWSIYQRKSHERVIKAESLHHLEADEASKRIRDEGKCDEGNVDSCESWTSVWNSHVCCAQRIGVDETRENPRNRNLPMGSREGILLKSRLLWS
jgi:hypothetical protein